MSDVTGADLEQLDALAASYQARGAEIAERALDLDRRLVDAVTTFQTALTELRTQVTSANEALLDDIDGLHGTAASTTWTGANRAVFDTELGLLEQGVTTTTESLTTRIRELESTGVVPFGEILASFGRQASAAGESAEQAGGAMQTRVAGQRAALADAADMGWSAV